MSKQWGLQTWGNTGELIQVAVDWDVQWKVGGISLDWSVIAAVAALTSEVQRLTVTGTPDGGSVEVSGINPATGEAFGPVTIAYNSSAAAAETAMEAELGAGNIDVTGGALPGTALDFTFKGDLANLPVATMTVDDDGLTGGTAPAAAFTTPTQGIGDESVNNGLVIQPGNKYLRYGQILTEITATGYYGPYDPNASDGRQLLTPGLCWILNETIFEEPLPGMASVPGDNVHIGVFDGGRAYLGRIKHSGSGSHSLAAGPTLAEFNTAFPRIQPVRF